MIVTIPTTAQRFFMTVSTHSDATVTSGLESDGTLLMNYGKFNTYRDGQQRVNATGSLSIPPNHSQGVSDETSAQQHSLTLSKIGLPPPSPPQRRSRTLMITVWYCVSVMILTQLTILRGICTDKCVMWSPSESGSVMSHLLFVY